MRAETARSVRQPVVDTGHGPVRGVDDGTVTSWKGIRYAAAPVGAQRWRRPQPPARWTEPLDAVAMGPVCHQPTDPRIPLVLGAPQGDDCLTLNVWSPSDAAPGADLPVLVWVHGGAYLIGASAQPLYDGAVLAAGGAVVITVNYRLGAFGFLDFSELSTAHTTFESNLGLRDVLAALNWVQDNVAGFGGAPDRVTVFGESAGAAIITTLLASPEAEGLFSGAIAQSSPATSVYDAARSRALARRYLELLGLGVDDADRLPEVPAAALVTASKALFDEVPVRAPGTLAFAPVVDGDVVPDYPITAAREGRTHAVPLVIGTNEHEAALFRWMKSPMVPITPEAIKGMFAAIAAEQPTAVLPTESQLGATYRGRGKAPGLGVARDIGFRMPSLWYAEGHRAVAPVYVYRFDWATPMLRLLRLGGAHATELPFVWGNLVAGPKDPTFRLGGLKTGSAVSDRMRARWLNFAKDGRPNGPADGPDWPVYTAADRSVLVIGKADAVVPGLDDPTRAAWGDDVLSFR